MCVFCFYLLILESKLIWFLWHSCDVFTIFCNLVSYLLTLNIPSQLLEKKLPLLFFLSGFHSWYRLQYRLVPSNIANTVFYLRGMVRSRGQNEPIN